MDLDSFRNEYFKQKELEKIVKNRQLKRPKTNWIHITIFSVILVVICIAIGFVLCFIPVHIVLKILIYILCYLLFLEFYLRFFFVQIVKCYQHYAKEETRRRCMCIPSCSEYAIAVLKKYELIIALKKIHHRLFKVCRGEEYIIDQP